MAGDIEKIASWPADGEAAWPPTRLPGYLGGTAISGGTGPIDGFGGTIVGAFSVARRLTDSYSGNLIRLRRDSDDAESDFGVDGSGDLDTSAISTWLGGATGYVVTIYDQSGNSRNVTNSTTTEQPTYAATASGVTKPSALSVDASGTFLAYTASGTAFYSDQYAAVAIAGYQTEGQFQIRQWGGIHCSQLGALSGQDGTIEPGKSSSALGGGSNFKQLVEQRSTGRTSGPNYSQSLDSPGKNNPSDGKIQSVLIYDNGGTRTLQLRDAGAGYEEITSGIGTTQQPDSITWGSAGGGGTKDATNPNVMDGYIHELVIIKDATEAEMNTYEAASKTYYGY